MKSRLASISTIPNRGLISGWVKCLERYPLPSIPSVTWAEILTPLTAEAQRSSATDLLCRKLKRQQPYVRLDTNSTHQSKQQPVTLLLCSADAEPLDQKSYGQVFLGQSNIRRYLHCYKPQLGCSIESGGCHDRRDVVWSSPMNCIERWCGCFLFHCVRCWFSFFVS